MAVSKRTRFEVLRRDNYTCRYCRATENPLTIDHVTPVSLGGTDDPSNLVAACRDCNLGKSSTSPDADTVADVGKDARRWAAAMEEAARVMAAEVDTFEAYQAAFHEGWPRYKYAPRGIDGTLAALYNVGLPAEHITDAARIAGEARGVVDRAAYFAGICWKRVRRMQEIAQRIVDEGGDQ